MQNTDNESGHITTANASDQNNDDKNQPDTNSADNDQTGAPQLTDIELRVLGVLMEKQLTTPDQYPLTLNSVITACNQKSSREPISNYNQGEVHRALQTLDDKHFIRRERSARSEKFSQQFMNHLELGRKQQALLCVMMLRGPQTISELNTRTQRMCDFSDKDELEHCIDRLCNRDTPYATRLGQQAGQRGERIQHLFNGTPQAGNAVGFVHGSTAGEQPQTTPVARVDSNKNSNNTVTETQDDRIALLELEVATLNKNYNALKAETNELKEQIAALNVLTGHAKTS